MMPWIHRKEKMVAVFLPCERNTANRHIESHIFSEIRVCTNNTVHAAFEVLRTFLYVFMSAFRVFVR